jgi:LysR family glycine cleavage system transcriptional activator
MNNGRHRPLSIGPLRAFEAVARRLGFSAAAEELHLTQSAVSRQVRSLEDEVGAPLFLRGTRHVELTAAGAALLRTAAPLLHRLDTTVRQIRLARGRRHVSLATFASFASLWLLPRLPAFQQAHPDIDIRISADDQLVDLEDPDLDLALRHCRPEAAPPGAKRLFGETLTPVMARALVERTPRRAADLAAYTLLEEDSGTGDTLSWRRWLTQAGQPQLEPARWIYMNFTYQQVQAALAGQGVALARLPLITESLEREELIEPFGAGGRLASPYTYWLLRGPAENARPEVEVFAQWVLAQAALTRAAIGDTA